MKTIRINKYIYIYIYCITQENQLFARTVLLLIFRLDEEFPDQELRIFALYYTTICYHL